MHLKSTWIFALFVLGLMAALATSAAGQADAGYQVDTDASRIFIKVGSATVIGHEHGVEARLKSGHLTLGGTGELVFDMASFTADTAEARRRVGLEPGGISAADAKKVTQTMRGPEVLDVIRFPTATFKMTVVRPVEGRPTTPRAYLLEGNLNLHGTERPLQLRARLEDAQPPARLRLTGSFTIKGKDYGVKPYSTFLGMVKVADEIEITGDLILLPATTP